MFAALFPPVEVRRDIRDMLAGLPAAVDLTLVPAERIHLTLAFFGDATGSEQAIGRALEEAAASTVPFDLEIAGISGFPLGDSTRLLYAAVAAGQAEVSALHDALMRSLGPGLAPAEQEQFQPHFTVCRPATALPTGQFNALVAEARRWSWRFRADALHLVQSHRGPGKPRYDVIQSTGMAG